MARRRRRDLLDQGIDILLKKYLGSFWYALLSGPIKKLKAMLVEWLSAKWIKEDMNGFPEEDEFELLP